MKRVNVRELHHHTGATVDHVTAGNVVIIEKRGVPVAEIRPIARRTRPIPAAHWTFLEAFPKMPDDSGRAISEDRDR
jgi:antitoxin (DNA-binding transcriptional repressor) of toxin-antitoxin stability system